jgi:hypothetical protein
MLALVFGPFTSAPPGSYDDALVDSHSTVFLVDIRPAQSTGFATTHPCCCEQADEDRDADIDVTFGRGPQQLHDLRRAGSTNLASVVDRPRGEL